MHKRAGRHDPDIVVIQVGIQEEVSNIAGNQIFASARASKFNKHVVALVPQIRPPCVCDARRFSHCCQELHDRVHLVVIQAELGHVFLSSQDVSILLEHRHGNRSHNHSISY